MAAKKKGGVEKRIPSTTATQFPDNPDRPFWSLKDTPSTSDDFFDCYVAFKELKCHEYFWEWKDRKIDELLIKKLMDAYSQFFKKKPIGKDCFITFKVNGEDNLQTLGRLYMSIISATDFANNNNFHAPPVFEVTHTATSPDDLVHFANLYNETVGIATDKMGRDCRPKRVSIIPKHNFDTNWYAALNQYFTGYNNSFRCKLEEFRPRIPRAEIADSTGFIASTLATKRALSSYASFSKITGVKALPIVEASPLMFRGGLNPDRTTDFIETYPGTRSVTITPAFRYGYDLEQAKLSITSLNRALPRNKSTTFSQDDTKQLITIERIFAKHYNEALKQLPNLDDIPKHMANINKTVDPRLKQTFSLYSLGIPPELLGTGSAVLECIKEGLVKDLERFYPNIKQDLITAASLLNKENLNFLAKTHKGWKQIQNDIGLTEDYADASLGPNSTETFLHRNHTSNIFHLRSTKQDFSRDLQQAARLRHCLG
ncbi:phosphoenolpyruvate carboxylase [Nanoarchaeota archaeon]